MFGQPLSSHDYALGGNSHMLWHQLRHIEAGGFYLLDNINRLSADLWALIRGEREVTLDLGKILRTRLTRSSIGLRLSKQREISALVKSIFTPVKLLHDTLRPISSVA